MKVPILYREYISPHILVMEYIDGFAVNDKAALLANGYDLNEVGTKYVDNFIKQVMEDGFFHADPHPGNVRIQDGKIVWIDMGMMGRLTEHDRQLIAEAIEGVAMNNIGARSRMRSWLLGSLKANRIPASFMRISADLWRNTVLRIWGTLMWLK